MTNKEPTGILDDRMLSLAFRYRESYLWKVLNDTHIFAIELSDGRIGRICIMGNAGSSICAALFIGEEGFRDLLYMMTPDKSGYSKLEQFSRSFSLRYLGCDFSNKEDIQPSEARSARKFAKDNGIAIQRQDGYPDFTKHAPDCADFKIHTREDADAICEALEAALEVSRVLKEDDLLGLMEKGFFEKEDACGRLVPKFIPKLKKLPDGSFRWSKLQNKKPAPVKYPTFTLDVDSDEVLFDDLRNLPREDTLQMHLARVPMPYDDPHTGKSIFPLVMFGMFLKGETLMPFSCSEPTMRELHTLCNNFLSSQSLPEVIEVEDDLTEAFVSDFCHKLGIKLVRKKEMVELLDFTRSAFEDFLPYRF